MQLAKCWQFMKKALWSQCNAGPIGSVLPNSKPPPKNIRFIPNLYTAENSLLCSMNCAPLLPTVNGEGCG